MISPICRKDIDREAGNPWLCRCPSCSRERKEKEGGTAKPPAETLPLNELAKFRRGEIIGT